MNQRNQKDRRNSKFGMRVTRYEMRALNPGSRIVYPASHDSYPLSPVSLFPPVSPVARGYPASESKYT